MLTQYVKGWKKFKNFRPQALSYFIALFVLLTANIFSTFANKEIIADGFYWFDLAGRAVFNAVIVSLAANGEYGVLKSGKKQEQEIIAKTAPAEPAVPPSKTD
jgi:hypothetical protein